MKTLFKSILACVAVFIYLLTFNLLTVKAESNDYDSLIVRPKETALVSKRMDRLMYRAGILRYQKLTEGTYIIPLSHLDNKEAKLQQLQQSGLFELVEPDYKLSIDEDVKERNYVTIIKHPLEENDQENPSDSNNNIGDVELKEVTPNDNGFISQYYLRDIKATKAWSATVGNELLVGILDTGVDANHPDLVGKVSGGINDAYDLNDEIGHGTEVAGIIAANTNNNQGIAGISWNTKILAIKITDENGQAKVSTVVRALDEAYAKGVKILQVSLSTSQFSQVLKDAVEDAINKGMLVISTGGNTGIEELRYPAAFNGVIGVGAVDKNGKKESYSTTGQHISLVAPGSSIYTTSLSSSYVSVTGTSFAAPQIAGAAALVWSIAPNLSSEEVRQILKDSADDLGDPGRENVFGYGLLNTEAAVKLAKAKTNKIAESQEDSGDIEIQSWIKR